MNFGQGHFSNPKDRGASAFGRPGQMNMHSLAGTATSGNITSHIDGEARDLPGQRSFSQLTSDYGAGRHEAYDSPLAQPAYSEHGKVRVL
jgi:hypothetical protein